MVVRTVVSCVAAGYCACVGVGSHSDCADQRENIVTSHRLRDSIGRDVTSRRQELRLSRSSRRRARLGRRWRHRVFVVVDTGSDVRVTWRRARDNRSEVRCSSAENPRTSHEQQLCRCPSDPRPQCHQACTCSFETLLNVNGITLWCPLLPYGYSYKTSCARLG